MPTKTVTAYAPPATAPVAVGGYEVRVVGVIGVSPLSPKALHVIIKDPRGGADITK
jgi:hypothetical protein